MDPERVKKLYVSNNPDDHSLGRDFQRDVEQKAKTDARFAEASKGVMDFRRSPTESSDGDLDIPGVPVPAAPEARAERPRRAGLGARRRARQLGHHACSRSSRRRCERGYVVIAPDYRGSTGYGEAYHQAIDYGGNEVDDAICGRGLPEDAAARRSRTGSA